MQSEPQLPGEDLFARGLTDLAQGQITDYSLLVLIAAPRLNRLGIETPDPPWPRPAEHQLYARLEERLGTAAYSHYNSLLRRMSSYARARERELSRR